MQIVSAIEEIESERPLAIGMGNFDGVHRGHQKLLGEQKKWCQARDLSFVVVSFRPHPLKILKAPLDHFLLDSYEHKKEVLKALGVDVFVELSFDRNLSMMPPKAFLEKILFTRNDISAFFIGHDFAFGADKLGDYSVVEAIAKTQNIETISFPCYEFDGRTIHSRLIRQALAEGQVETVCQDLGREFLRGGRVIKGLGRGKTIGYPTANIDVDSDLCLPKEGVYVGMCYYKNLCYQSITNVGSNPTFKEQQLVHIETHLFDFDSDIYGEHIEVSFLQRIRDEKKFSSVNELIAQIKKDVLRARAYFSQ